MADMGLRGALGAQALHDALQQRIRDQMTARQQELEMSIAQRKMDLAEQRQRLDIQNNEEDRAQRTQKMEEDRHNIAVQQAHDAYVELPKGAQVSGEDYTATYKGTPYAGGLTANQTLPSTQMAIGRGLPPGQMSSMAPPPDVADASASGPSSDGPPPIVGTLRMAPPDVMRTQVSPAAATGRYTGLGTAKMQDEANKQEFIRGMLRRPDLPQQRRDELDMIAHGVPVPTGWDAKPAIDPTATHAANRRFDLANPLPVHEPRQPDPQPQLYFGKDGTPHAIQFRGGAAREIPLPTGLDLTGKTGPAASKPLPYQAAENLKGLNVADVEGTKVLKALHESGLDQSNDPADPRWQKFLAATLKIQGGDYTKADIQQRVAFTSAALTRNLMGGRPSQYIAQMLQQHLPQGEMTGQKLAHVMTNVLEQTTENRKESANLLNKPYESVLPVSGQHYQQYLDSVAGIGGGQISVTAPDGSVHPFATQALADAFKRNAGIR